MAFKRLFRAPRVTAALRVAAIAVLVVGSLALYGATSTGQAQAPEAGNVDYFLRIEGVEGESTDERYEGWIELTSFSWGESLPGLQQSAGAAAGGGGGAGKVVFQDFHFSKRLSKATPKLMLACASGQHLPEALLVMRRAGRDQQEYLRYKFSDVVVSSYPTSGGVEGSEPTDEVSLSFGRFEIEYRPQNVDGTLAEPIRAGWDVRANTAL
jgi:type VI secretion system secreted protein Hcp